MRFFDMRSDKNSVSLSLSRFRKSTSFSGNGAGCFNSATPLFISICCFLFYLYAGVLSSLPYGGDNFFVVCSYARSFTSIILFN